MATNSFYKKIVNVVVCAAMCFAGSGCDFIYHLLQKEGAEEKELLGEVNALEKNENVALMQKLLKLFGYKIGKIDGVLGVNTRNAIEAFQADNDLKTTRFLDKATWEQLNIFESYGLVVKGEINAKTIQQALKAAGYNPGPIDGKWGNKTQTAIKNFQKAKRLKPDGRIGYKTLKELTKYLKAEE